MHAFDRQTDGQTDRNLIVRPRLHSMQRGKNSDTDVSLGVRSALFCCSGNARVYSVLCRALLWCSLMLVTMTRADILYFHIHETIIIIRAYYYY